MNLKKFVKKQVKDYTESSFKHGARIPNPVWAKACANIDAGYMQESMQQSMQNSYTMDPYETTYGKHCKPCGKITDLM